MPVQINEIIIRAIITNDDKEMHPKIHGTDKKKEKDDDENKIEMLELIDEVIKNKKER